MGTITRRLAVNIGLFLTENNIRRGLASFSSSYATQSASAANVVRTLNAGESFTLTPVRDVNDLTFIRVTQPILAEVTVGAITVGVTPRPATTFTVLVTSQLLLDDQVTQVVLTNPQTTETDVSIIQG